MAVRYWGPADLAGADLFQADLFQAFRDMALEENLGPLRAEAGLVAVEGMIREWCEPPPDPVFFRGVMGETYPGPNGLPFAIFVGLACLRRENGAEEIGMICRGFYVGNSFRGPEDAWRIMTTGNRLEDAGAAVDFCQVHERIRQATGLTSNDARGVRPLHRRPPFDAWANLDTENHSTAAACLKDY